MGEKTGADLCFEFEGDLVEFSLDFVPDAGDCPPEEQEAALDDGEVQFVRGGDEPASDQVPDELDRLAVDEVPVSRGGHELGQAEWMH